MANVTKKDVIRLLETIATYLEIKGENAFKVLAYRRAANVLETIEEDIHEIEDFTKIPSIGKGTGAIIEEFIGTGRSELLDQLKKEIPTSLITLLQLPGLGGKKISKLYQELQIENVEDLKEACLQGKVRELSGFGKKTEEKLLKAIENHTNQGRLPLAYMLTIGEKIEQQLDKMTSIVKYSRAGSLRRVRETVKDLDFIIATNEPEKVREQLLQLEGIKQQVAAGDTKVSLIFGFDRDVSVDFRLVAKEEFATTLHHFTGSKDHNIRMRQLAKERGEKMNEYGVEIIKTGEIITFKTEEEFFHHFGLPYIPPELREDGREVDEFSPDLELVSIEDIRGDLHMHTTWSDGAHKLEEMIEACIQLGYEYLAITDHSKFLKVANGLDEERLFKQMEEIKRLKGVYKEITILSGIEMDILPDGSLDFSDNVLKEMDIVIASIHSHFNQPKEKIMARLHEALKNPYVHIIAHPTGRKIGFRDGYTVDLDELFILAKETGTALELNANPNRLDLNAKLVERAQKLGVSIVINTDAHHIDHLSYMKLGVQTGRKGWLKKDTVLNTKNIEDLLSFLKKKKV